MYIDVQYIMAMLTWSKFLVLSGEPESSIPILKEKFKGTSFEKKARELLARAYEAIEDYSGASKTLEELVRDYPGDRKFKRRYESLKERVSSAKL